MISAQRYQKRLLGPFINQPDDVEQTNGYFQQDSAYTIGTAIRKIII
jgi:hypothetical protein